MVVKNNAGKIAIKIRIKRLGPSVSCELHACWEVMPTQSELSLYFCDQNVRKSGWVFSASKN